MTKEEIKKEPILKENQQKKQKDKNFTTMNLSIWRIFAYFILYSIGGYIIETIFGIVTKGVWESRQSFMYRPFLCNLWTWSNNYYNVIT